VHYAQPEAQLPIGVFGGPNGPTYQSLAPVCQLDENRNQGRVRRQQPE